MEIDPRLPSHYRPREEPQQKGAPEYEAPVQQGGPPIKSVPDADGMFRGYERRTYTDTPPLSRGDFSFIDKQPEPLLRRYAGTLITGVATFAVLASVAFGVREYRDVHTQRAANVQNYTAQIREVANRTQASAPTEMANAINNFKSNEGDPQKVKDYMDALFYTVGPANAMKALLYAEAGPAARVIPTGVEFDRYVEYLANKKGMKVSSYRGDRDSFIRDFYSNQSQAFAYGEINKYVIAGTAINSAIRSTGIADRQVINDLMNAGTSEGEMAKAWIRQHNGQYPTFQELEFSRRTNSITEGPRMPGNQNVIGREPRIVDRLNNPSTYQPGPRGQEGFNSAVRDAERGAQIGIQSAQQDMQRVGDAAAQRAQEGINQAGQQLGNAINDLLNPKKKQ